MSEEENLARAERQAEQQRAARERESLARAGDGLLRDIDAAMARPDIATPTEVGRGPEVTPPPAPQTRELEERMLDLKRQQLKRGLSLVRMTKELSKDTPLPPMRYDSPERREAIQRHMEAQGVDPHLRAIRDLIEKGQAEPPSKAAERNPNMTGRGVPQGGRDPRNRGTERGPDGQYRSR